MKLISLNIEGSKHLHRRVLPFLKKQQPDVVCLQEVFAVAVEEIEETLRMKGRFVPLANVDKVTKHTPKPLGLWGIYVGSRLPTGDVGHAFYKGNDGQTPTFLDNDDPNAISRAVIWTEVSDGEEDYMIVNTHFVWSPKGQPTEYQHQHLEKLFEITKRLSPHILCGDFNAPRGGEIFTRLAQNYRDNIPLETTTTLDKRFHYAGELNYVVDGMFSQPGYELSEVKVIDGLSDHMAIVAKVEKRV